MPRKIKSSAEPTQQKKTSERRASGQKKADTSNSSSPSDGGKWAGSGRKTVEHSQGPAIARQKQTGRGAKTRTAMRADKVNHPNHG